MFLAFYNIGVPVRACLRVWAHFKIRYDSHWIILAHLMILKVEAFWWEVLMMLFHSHIHLEMKAKGRLNLHTSLLHGIVLVLPFLTVFLPKSDWRRPLKSIVLLHFFQRSRYCAAWKWAQVAISDIESDYFELSRA